VVPLLSEKVLAFLTQVLGDSKRMDCILHADIVLSAHSCHLQPQALHLCVYVCGLDFFMFNCHLWYSFDFVFQREENVCPDFDSISSLHRAFRRLLGMFHIG